MRAILRQIKANLKSQRSQLVLVLATLLAAATLLTLALITFRTASGAYDRLFERTHGAHLWLYLDSRRVTVEEVVQVLAELAGVEETTGVIHALSVNLYLGEESLRSQELREWPDEAASVAHPLLIAGRAPEPGETDAIVLDRNVAATYELKVGDTIDLMTPDGRQPLNIVGLQVNAIHCPFPNCQPAREYVAPGALTDLRASFSTWPGAESLAVGLRLRDPAEREKVVQATREALPPSAIVSWWDWEEVRPHCDESVRLQRILFTAFSIVAGLAAGLLMANIIVGAVRAQTRQIGLLKAVGFTGWQLALVYLIEYLGLALVASLGGLGLGGLLASTILRTIALRFGETLVHPPPWVVLATPLITLLVSTLFALGPVRRAVRQDAIQAIRVGAERPRRRAVRLLRLPLCLAMGVGDTLSQPTRSVLTVLGLGVTSVALTFALTTIHTVRAYATNPSLGGMRDGDLLVYPRGIGTTEVHRLIEERPEVAGFYGELVAHFQFPGEEEILQAHFLQGNLEIFRFSLVEGRMLGAPDEAVVSYVLARERHLRPGDTMTILLEEEPMTLRIVGIYRESLNLGRMLMLPIEVLHRVQPAAAPSPYVLKADSGVDVQALAAALESDAEGRLRISEITLPRELTLLPKTLTILSLVLAGIAILGVFNTAWMAVQERQREFGLLKATGMTPGQVTLFVLAGVVVMALAAYGMGVAVGLPGAHLLFDVLGRGMGFGPMDALVDVLGEVLLLPGITVLAVLAAFLPAHRASRVSVVEMLRYE